MNFIYRPAQMKDLEELGHLFIETFIHRDPMTAHLQLTENEAMDYCRVIFPESIKDALTCRLIQTQTKLPVLPVLSGKISQMTHRWCPG